MINKVLIVKEGVPLFWYDVVEDKMGDPLLASGLLNTVFQLARTELKKDIDIIKINSSYVCMKEFPPLLVVVIGSDPSEAKALMEKVGVEFLKEYGEKLSAWNGEITVFEGFRKKIVQLLERRKTLEELETELKKILSSVF